MVAERLADSAESRLEARVRARLSGAASDSRVRKIPAVDRAKPITLSYGQQQLWVQQQINPSSSEYNVPLALRLRGRLDAERLGRAWEAVCARHDILRTRYVIIDGQPVQAIDPPASPFFELTDVSSEDSAYRVMDEELARPFDLATQWPARAKLLRLAAEDHVLLIVCHHIACDAPAMQVISGELGAAYADGALQPIEGPQYADYAAWERDGSAGSALERGLGYWREQLAGWLPAELPVDHRRSAVRGYRGESAEIDLGDLTAGVEELARMAGATPFMVLLAAFYLLLSRYTGTSDICVGTVVSNRDRPDLFNLVGYCINTLVMRGRWSGDPSFLSLVQLTRTTVLDAYDHRRLPFALLVDEMDPERDLSRTPLYQVAFTMHEERAPHFVIRGIEATQFGADDAVAKCDLALQVLQGNDGQLSGRFVYSTALFSQDTVQRFAGHFARLLSQVTADPQSRLSAVQLLGEPELATVARPQPDLARGQTATLHEIFQESTRRAPRAPAVTAGAVTLTYEQVRERASRLAGRLRDLGARPEQLVGLYLERDRDLIPALLGILMSGAGYLPLDPVHPADRLDFMLRDAGVQLLVTSAELEGRLAPAWGGRVVIADEVMSARAGALDPADAVEPAGPFASAQNIAYSIYTSGSTGAPKGVVVSHDNVVRLVTTAQEHFGFGPDDVFSMTHSPSFDVSVFEMWAAFTHGARLVVVPADVTRSPEELRELLDRETVTVLSQTPTAFGSLAARGPLGVRTVVFAGEPLDFAGLRSWAQGSGLDAPALVNMYGITETTVHTTYHRVTEADLGPEGGNPIGHPLSDLAVRLLDEWGNLVPIGVAGEIHVAGPGVTRGYLGRPGLTAGRFVPDPLGAPGSRTYRSGDLARWRPDGSLEFLGRTDHQVKIRGYRVELGEIEAVLTTHPQVRQALVVKQEQASGARIIAYVVPEQAAPPPAELAAHCASALPDYMVPAAFLALHQIPVNANGKLDRSALPPVERQALRASGERVAPRTPDELRMAAAWAQVLGVAEVGVHDSFFDLGGDSIRAVALRSEERRVGKECVP